MATINNIKQTYWNLCSFTDPDNVRVHTYTSDEDDVYK